MAPYVVLLTKVMAQQFVDMKHNQWSIVLKSEGVWDQMQRHNCDVYGRQN